MDDGDRRVGQFQAGIERLDRRMRPFPDLAKENVGENLAGEPDLVGADAVDIDDGNHASDDDRKLAQARASRVRRMAAARPTHRNRPRGPTRSVPASEPTGS